jgi:hypothetical protein
VGGLILLWNLDLAPAARVQSGGERAGDDHRTRHGGA